MHKGNFQFFFWGWNADYPDPENFFFLLFGPNGKVKHKGENAANYDNPRFNTLFKQMENMDNSSDRLAIIREMNDILMRDATWAGGYHPVSFSLSHKWMENLKANSMANNTLKYIAVDAAAREKLRFEWNRPRVLPLAIIAAVFLALSVPALVTIIRKLRGVSR